LAANSKRELGDANLSGLQIWAGSNVITRSDAAKLFASLHALYRGLALIAVVGIMHRFLHKFHIADG